MEHSWRSRRGFLRRLAAGLAAGLGAGIGAAQALGVPAGKVLLTLTGKVTRSNEAGAASFDLAMLQALPQSHFSTRTPWYPEPRRFSGVLVRDLLAAVGAQGTTVRASALNDYRVEIPSAELIEHGAMIVCLLDDKPISVRERGPLLIMFPFDDKPALRTAVHYSRAIWQLRHLEVR